MFILDTQECENRCISACEEISKPPLSYKITSDEILGYFLQIKYYLLDYCFSNQIIIQPFDKNFQLHKSLNDDQQPDNYFYPAYSNITNEPWFNEAIELFSDEHLPSYFLNWEWKDKPALPNHQALIEEVKLYHLTTLLENANGNSSLITDNNPSLSDCAEQAIFPFGAGFVVGALAAGGFYLLWNKISDKISNKREWNPLVKESVNKEETYVSNNHDSESSTIKFT